MNPNNCKSQFTSNISIFSENIARTITSNNNTEATCNSFSLDKYPNSKLSKLPSLNTRYKNVFETTVFLIIYYFFISEIFIC